MTPPIRREPAEGVWPPMARTWVVAVLLVLVPMAGGCATVHLPGSAARSMPPAAGARRGGERALAAAYLAIAQPANRRLDAEVNGFTDHQHQDLAAAEAALRAEAATERRFDRLLARIPFPPAPGFYRPVPHPGQPAACRADRPAGEIHLADRAGVVHRPAPGSGRRGRGPGEDPPPRAGPAAARRQLTSCCRR
jgi:hypothetical protein